MSKKKLVIKIVVNLVSVVVLWVITKLLFYNPIIANDIAIGQMSNSDEAFLLMEYYNKIKEIAPSVTAVFSGYLMGSTIYNIIKFITNKGEE